MRVLLISTNVFPLPPQGYSGTEALVHALACGLAAKHQVSVVAPEGSTLPDGIQLIASKVGESEESAYARLYRERIEKGEWDCIGDHSFEAWSYTSAIGRDPAPTIVHTVHTHPSIYTTPPPVLWPRFVGISDSHCRLLSLHLGIAVKRVYNGIDLDFYKPDPKVKRDGRYLSLGRYTAEKGMLQSILMAKKLRLDLDCIGDQAIVASKEYVDRCRAACDGMSIRAVGGVTREETVTQYRTHKALLFPLQWDEPFGLVPVESSACGTPVLTLDRGAMREIVKNGENGYVCESEEEMEARIKSGDLEKLDPARIRKAVERYSLQNMIDAYERIYLSAAAGERW